MPTETLDFAADIKAISDGDAKGTFEGYGSVFGVEDFVRDIVAAGAFKKTIRAHKRKGRMPALLWQHDTREPIGVWDQMKEDGKGLYVKGRLLVDDVPKARQAHALLKENGISGLSIGFRTVMSEMNEKTGVRTLTEIELFETSLVTFPALDSARVDAVKAEDIRDIIEDGETPDQKTLEAYLRDAGLSRREAKAFLSLGYQGLIDVVAEKNQTLRDAGDGNKWAAMMRDRISALPC